jgi:hypothetical protein
MQKKRQQEQNKNKKRRKGGGVGFALLFGKARPTLLIMPCAPEMDGGAETYSVRRVLYDILTSSAHAQNTTYTQQTRN